MQEIKIEIKTLIHLKNKMCSNKHYILVENNYIFSQEIMRRVVVFYILA